MNRRRFLAVAVAVQLWGASAALGAFSGSAAAGHTISTATLLPPTNLSAGTSCEGGLLNTQAKAVISWTPTQSDFASGYVLQRWQGSTLQSTEQVTPRTATSRTHENLASLGTTYTWKIHAYVAGTTWTSIVAQVSATTPVLCAL